MRKREKFIESEWRRRRILTIPRRTLHNTFLKHPAWRSRIRDSSATPISLNQFDLRNDRSVAGWGPRARTVATERQNDRDDWERSIVQVRQRQTQYSAPSFESMNESPFRSIDRWCWRFWNFWKCFSIRISGPDWTIDCSVTKKKGKERQKIRIGTRMNQNSDRKRCKSLLTISGLDFGFIVALFWDLLVDSCWEDSNNRHIVVVNRRQSSARMNVSSYELAIIPSSWPLLTIEHALFKQYSCSLLDSNTCLFRNRSTKNTKISFKNWQKITATDTPTAGMHCESYTYGQTSIKLKIRQWKIDREKN